MYDRERKPKQKEKEEKQYIALAQQKVVVGVDDPLLFNISINNLVLFLQYTIHVFYKKTISLPEPQCS